MALCLKPVTKFNKLTLALSGSLKTATQTSQLSLTFEQKTAMKAQLRDSSIQGEINVTGFH